MRQQQLNPLCPFVSWREERQPRYMFDSRCNQARGGPHIACRCRSTAWRTAFDLAWAHWHEHLGLQSVGAHDQPAPDRVSQPALSIAVRG